MKYRINTYNKNYIMLETKEISWELAKLVAKNNEEDIELIEILRNIKNKISDYELKQSIFQKRHLHIFELAIDINSKLGKIITERNKTEYITIEQIFHALLICIDRRQWEYYDDLLYIIKKYTAKYFKEIEYEHFKLSHGEEITNYIINSNLLILSNEDITPNNVYLYENDTITKTELPKNKLKKNKRKLYLKRNINNTTIKNKHN